MDDPREVLSYDPYSNISSDGEEETELTKQIEEIEKQKEDLMKRLQRKKKYINSCDPNFIQIERSPKKEKELESEEDARPQIDHEQANLNESKILSRPEIPSNSSSYFVQKFQNAKTEEKREIHERQELLSSRVHSFAGISGEEKSSPTNEQEEYSNLWIKQRYLSKERLHEALREIKILRLGKLFAKVKPPKFTEPQYSNWAAIGILSGKADIKFTSGDKPKKYFKFTLTDFQFNLDVYIFGKHNVERYYNLRVGDVIAILNPEILPWRPSTKGSFIKSFNLRIAHNFPCILEIGASRDLGWCGVFNKAQNKPCGTPINKGKEKCCDYHKETSFRSTNAKRVELSGSFALGAPTRIEAQPALYRERTSKSSNDFKVLPSWSQRGINKHKEQEGRAYHFSNNNAAKAFFNEKFQNPDLLNNLDVKRRKILDKKKSSLIDRKLKCLLNKQSADMMDKNSETYETIRKTTETTLQSGLIQSVGFDPTHGKIAAILKNGHERSDSSQLSDKQTVVTSILNIKKANVVLKPSREIQLEKKRHRDQVWQEHFGKKVAENSGDSDSDLEIVS